jgi:hypothetical protein
MSRDEETVKPRLVSTLGPLTFLTVLGATVGFVPTCFRAASRGYSWASYNFAEDTLNQLLIGLMVGIALGVVVDTVPAMRRYVEARLPCAWVWLAFGIILSMMLLPVIQAAR